MARPHSRRLLHGGHHHQDGRPPHLRPPRPRPLDPARKIDGVDLRPVLAATPPRDTFTYHRGVDLEPIRSGPWKLHLKKKGLHQLTIDIGEATDVAARNPDVFARLVALAAATDSDLGVTGLGPGVRALDA